MVKAFSGTAYRWAHNVHRTHWTVSVVPSCDRFFYQSVPYVTSQSFIKGSTTATRKVHKWPQLPFLKSSLGCGLGEEGFPICSAVQKYIPCHLSSSCSTYSVHAAQKGQTVAVALSLGVPPRPFGGSRLFDGKLDVVCQQLVRAKVTWLHDSGRQDMALKRPRTGDMVDAGVTSSEGPESDFAGVPSKSRRTSKALAEGRHLSSHAMQPLPAVSTARASQIAPSLSELPSTSREEPILIEDEENDKLKAWRERKLCHRQWEYTELGKNIERRRDGHEFTIITYNLLAQNLLEDNSYLYSACKEEWCLWPYRRQRLLSEIARYQPDILCCQEVNEDHYDDFYQPELEKLGYEGAFKKRTRGLLDGCATFYKKTSFDCEAVVPIEYLRPNVAVLDRDNIALVMVLRPKQELSTSGTASHDAPRLCIANTHLLFNPRRGDVKLAQLMLLFAELDRLAWRSDRDSPSHHPVMMCGDLNMEPFSHLYRFIKHGSLALQGLWSKTLSGQERGSNRGGKTPMSAGFLDRSAGITDTSQYVDVCLERLAAEHRSLRGAKEGDKDDANEDIHVTSPLPQGSGVVSHRFNLKSVYKHFWDNGRSHPKRRAREVTTCHDRANCTVDYIFYSTEEAYSSSDEVIEISSSSTNTSSEASTDSSSSEESVNEGSRKSSAGVLKAKGRQRVSDSSSSSESPSNPEDQSISRMEAPGEVDEANWKLQLLARLRLLNDKEMRDIGSLPNDVISSDHLLLAAQFRLAKT